MMSAMPESTLRWQRCRRPPRWHTPPRASLRASCPRARVLEIPTPRWSTYDSVKHGKPLPTKAPATVQQRAWTSPIWYTPTDQDRSERPSIPGLYTVADLAAHGIAPMTDEEILAVTSGHTIRSVNLITGYEVILHHWSDGNRSLMGLADRPVVTPYTIQDGRRIETSLLGDHMSVALYPVDGRILGARDDEAGYVNYEAITLN